MGRILFLQVVLILGLFEIDAAYSQNLSGNYRIGSSSVADYATPGDAVRDAVSKGISGTVRFQIEDGTYQDTLWIDSIAGASATNRLILESLSGDSSKVDIVYSGSAASGVVVDIAADFITLRNLGVRFTSQNSAQYAVRIAQRSTDIRIQNCRLVGDSSGYGIALGLNLNAGFNFSVPYENIEISNNYFNGIDFAFIDVASVFSGVNNLSIRNNHMLHVESGIRATNVDDITITGNRMYANPSSSTGIVLTLAEVDTALNRVRVAYNEVYNFNTAAVLSVSANLPASKMDALVFNNFFQGGEGLRTDKGYELYYNTILSTRSDGAALALYQDSTIILNNNIVARGRNGQCIRLNSDDTVFQRKQLRMDYNNLYSRDSIIAFTGINLANFQRDTLFTLSEWRQFTGLDSNSLSVVPGLRNDTDLHASNGALKAGLPVNQVTDDIDREPRDPNTPSIGADEITDVANLVPKSLRLRTNNPLAGRGLPIEYEVRNEGALRVFASWRDGFYLSRDNQLDAGDLRIGSSTRQVDLASSSSYKPRLTLTLPDDSSGRFYLLVRVNDRFTTAEDVADNVLASSPFTITIPPRPDLSVTNLSGPSSALSGKQITLTWTVENDGQRPTSGAWTDKIYAARDQNQLTDPQLFNPDSTFVTAVSAPTGLQTGASYQQSVTLTLPLRFSGSLHYMVLADAEDGVNEADDSFADNRSAAFRLPISQSPLPDLRITQFRIPETTFSGDSIAVSYTVKNFGNATTIQVGWRDRVIFTQDSVLDLNDPSSFDERQEFGRSGVLEPDSSYVVQDTIALPDCISGKFGVFYQTDHEGTVFELTEGNNIAGPDSIEILIQPKPDLIVDDLQVVSNSLQTGKDASFSYTVKNDGFSEAYNFNSWYDRLYISNQPTFDADRATSIGVRNGPEFVSGQTFTRDTLQRGASYTRTVSARLPDSLFGPVYFYLFTDVSDQVCESPNEDNNTGRSARQNVQLSPPADLQAVNPAAPGRLFSGAQFTYFLTTRNAGSGPTLSRENGWEHHIFLVPENGRIEDGFKLGETNFTGQLVANDTYTDTLSLVVPRRIESGAYQLLFWLDRDDDVYEHQAEGNNRVRTPAFQIDYDNSLSSDLRITNLNVSGRLESGREIDVTAQITNLGPRRTATAWADRLFLLDENGIRRQAEAVRHTGALDSGESYTLRYRYMLPNGRSGDFELVAQADPLETNLDYQRTNNRIARSITVSLSQPADLQASSFTFPDTVHAGQELIHQIEVQNQGPGEAFQTPWEDAFFLSEDTLLDLNDFRLGLDQQMSTLGDQQRYTIVDTTRLSRTLQGYFHILHEADRENAVYEAENENNNIVYSRDRILVEQPAPCDLNVTTGVQITGNRTARYLLRNDGPNPAEGTWFDEIYLSTDAQLDENDRRLRVVNSEPVQRGVVRVRLGGDPAYRVAGPIAPNNADTQEVNFILPPVAPDFYYYIVKLDGQNFMPETDEQNNLVVSDSVFIDNIPRLPLDSVRRDSFNRLLGRERYYQLERGADTGMVVRLTAVDQNTSNELYHRKEGLPTLGAFDNRFSASFQADQEVIVPTEPEAVKDFILTRNDYIPPYTNVAYYDIEAQSATYSLYSVSPVNGGNYGQVSLRMRGFDFADSMEFMLMNNRDTAEAFAVIVESSTNAIAHFNLQFKDTGRYDVVARNPFTGDTTVLDNGFRVLEGGFPDYYAAVSTPALSRLGRPFTTQVFCGNRGQVNAYDVFLIIAFFQDSASSDDLNIQFSGSSMDALYEDPADNPFPVDDSNLIRLDSMVFFPVYLPAFPSRSLGDFTFKISSPVAGKIRTVAFFYKPPESLYSLAGRFDEMTTATSFREVAAASGRVLEDISRNKAYNCEDFNYDNIKKDLFDNVKKVAERAQGANLGAKAGSSLFDVAKDKLFEKAKSDGKSLGKSVIKDWIKNDKSFEENAREKTDEYVENGLSTDPVPFKDFAETLDKCIDNDNIEEEVIDRTNKCIKRVAVGTEDRGDGRTQTVYRYVNTCCKGCNPGGGGDDDATDNQPPKDPNEIVGPGGKGSLRLVTTEDEMGYTVFFENVPEARVPAQQVTIDNPLDDAFRLQDLELLEFGFGDTSFTLPGGASFNGSFQLGPKYDNYRLELIAGLDVINRRLFWRMTTIDPKTGNQPSDPNGGFLPPNDSTGVGEGFVRYRLSLEPNSAPGTVVANQADIIFDEEQIITTNTWENLVAGQGYNSRVMALDSVQPDPRFDVSWEGFASDSVGMGIRAYDVYVARGDTGAYEQWISETTTQRGIFQGVRGESYRFFSVAIGEDGSTEEVPASFDAITRVADTAASNGPVPRANEAGGLELNLYPNPARGWVALRFRMPQTGQARLRVSDVSGKQLIDRPLGLLSKGFHDYRLAVTENGLTPGLYFVELIAGEGQSTAQPLMVRP